MLKVWGQIKMVCPLNFKNLANYIRADDEGVYAFSLPLVLILLVTLMLYNVFTGCAISMADTFDEAGVLCNAKKKCEHLYLFLNFNKCFVVSEIYELELRAKEYERKLSIRETAMKYMQKEHRSKEGFLRQESNFIL